MRMSRQQFEELALQAYAELPAPVLARLDNLDIIVEDAPGPEAEGADDDGGGLLGLYVGVPLVERYAADPLLPDCIYIYRRPILSVCDSYDAVVHEIRTTLRHEIGHYLGLSEQDLDRLGYG